MSGLELRSICVQKLTLGVIETLSKRIGIQDVVLDQKGPCDQPSITSWESINCCSLPADLKEFYLTSNGFLLTWKVKMKEDSIPVGRMEINPVNKLEKLQPIYHQHNSGSVNDIDLTEEEDPYGDVPHFDTRSRLFELDPCQNTGKVCLVYRNTKQGVPARDAEYWFLDKSLRWHYITNNFSSYFRIMLLKLGLPQWHYLFTDIGVSPTVTQWYNLYAPSLTDQSLPPDNLSGKKEHIEIANAIDIARVFKGKDKKKPATNTSNPPANRRKVGSPTQARNVRGTTSALHKSASGQSANR